MVLGASINFSIGKNEMKKTLIAIISASMLVGCAAKPQQATDLNHRQAAQLRATAIHCKGMNEIDTAMMGTLHNMLQSAYAAKVYDPILVKKYSDEIAASGQYRDCSELYALVEKYKQVQQHNAEVSRMSQQAWNNVLQDNKVKVEADCTRIGDQLMCY